MANELDFSCGSPVFGKDLLGGNGQLARALWVAKRVRDDDVFLMQDGALSKLLLEEFLSSFVAGQYIATIVLGFSLIERTIAGRLAFVGDKSKTSSAYSHKLLEKALDRQWIRKDEYELLGELRKLRNPVVHFRDHLSETRPEVRAASSERSTLEVLEEDAKRIIDAVINLLGKTAM